MLIVKKQDSKSKKCKSKHDVQSLGKIKIIFKVNVQWRVDRRNIVTQTMSSCEACEFGNFQFAKYSIDPSAMKTILYLRILLANWTCN